MKIRQLAYDQTFWEQATLLQPDAKRLDEIIDGALWLIATHADECEKIDERLRVAFTDPFPDAPPMRIFFTIKDENTCVLHWIEHLPITEDEEYL